MKKIIVLILILLSSATIWAEEDILIPVDEDPENPSHNNRRRSAPRVQWVNINTEELTVTTTLTDPVITYYILDASGELVIVAADAAEQFAADVAALPSGAYTIRLLTVDRSFSGPLAIN